MCATDERRHMKRGMVFQLRDGSLALVMAPEIPWAERGHGHKDANTDKAYAEITAANPPAPKIEVPAEFLPQEKVMVPAMAQAHA